MAQVINLFGGPCTGKSTRAAGLFYKMKKNGFNVEYVYEYAKELTYEQRQNVLNQDQLYVFAKQHRKVNRLIPHLDYIVLDSPLILSNIYFNPNTNPYSWEVFEPLILDTFNKYNNVNFLLDPPDEAFYQKTGRNQTCTEAIEVHNTIKTYLDSRSISYYELSWDAGNMTIFKHLGIY